MGEKLHKTRVALEKLDTKVHNFKVSKDGRRWRIHRPSVKQLSTGMKAVFDFKVVTLQKSFFDRSPGESVRRTIERKSNCTLMCQLRSEIAKLVGVRESELLAPTRAAAAKALWVVDDYLGYKIAGTTQLDPEFYRQEARIVVEYFRRLHRRIARQEQKTKKPKKKKTKTVKKDKTDKNEKTEGHAVASNEVAASVAAVATPMSSGRRILGKMPVMVKKETTKPPSTGDGQEGARDADDKADDKDSVAFSDGSGSTTDTELTDSDSSSDSDSSNDADSEGSDADEVKDSEESSDEAEDEEKNADEAKDDGKDADKAIDEGKTADEVKDEEKNADEAKDDGKDADKAIDEGKSADKAKDEEENADEAKDDGKDAETVDEGKSADKAKDEKKMLNNDDKPTDEKKIPKKDDKPTDENQSPNKDDPPDCADKVRASSDTSLHENHMT